MDIAEQQRKLRSQLEDRRITDVRVLDAIERVRRDRFVPAEHQAMAYADEALPLASGQTISQPYVVALMTQELKLTGGEKVLEIGTGSGYQAAVLAELCGEVVTIERLEELAIHAREVLSDLGYDNIEFYSGDGTLGVPQRAPYDGILVTAASPETPRSLVEQLRPGGRMIIPVGGEAGQELQLIRRDAGGAVSTERLCAVRFVKLIGESGWRES